MRRSIPMKNGIEYDALTEWKNYLNFRSGIRKEIKQEFNKRERRFVKKQLREELAEYIKETKEEI